jgi:hypothetical protein
MLTLSSMGRGSGRRSRAAFTKLPANRAAGPKSNSRRVARLTAMAGTPSSEASMAAATVPE